MRLEPVARFDLAGSERALHARVGLIVDLKTLPAKVDRQITHADLVLHMILQRVGVEIEQPLREERVAQEFGVIEARIGQALIGVKTARLRKVIMLIPAADADRVIPNFGLK